MSHGTPGAPSPPPPETSRKREQLGPRKAALAFPGFQSLPSPKELEKVVKLELLRPQGPEEIARIWGEFHADGSKGRVGAVISSAQYAHIHRHGPESPVHFPKESRESG